MQNLLRCPCLVLIALLSACNVSEIEDGSKESPESVCGHSYKEPVFNISYAVDAIDGDSLSEVALRNVTVNGRPVTDYSTVLVAAKNIHIRDGVMVCTLPCGFGVEEGTYRLYVDAPGHQTQQVSVQANYRVYSGGCPSYSDLGYYVGVSLEH